VRPIVDVRFNGGEPVITVEPLGYMKPAEALLFAEEVAEAARRADPRTPLLGREYRWARVVRAYRRSRDRADRAHRELDSLAEALESLLVERLETTQAALAEALASANHWKQARETCMEGAQLLVQQRDDLRRQLDAALARASGG
jgi:hypothetical protein